MVTDLVGFWPGHWNQLLSSAAGGWESKGERDSTVQSYNLEYTLQRNETTLS